MRYTDANTSEFREYRPKHHISRTGHQCGENVTAAAAMTSESMNLRWTWSAR